MIMYVCMYGMDSSVQEEEESPRFLNLTHLKKEKNYNVFVESK